jgi:hypothetical protein
LRGLHFKGVLPICPLTLYIYPLPIHPPINLPNLLNHLPTQPSAHIPILSAQPAQLPINPPAHVTTY